MKKNTRGVNQLFLSKRKVFAFDADSKRKVPLAELPPLSRRISFQVAVAPQSEVFLAGTFNNWDPKRHPMKDLDGTGKHTLILMLPEGEYEYKFVINGNWIADPENRCSMPNAFGTVNSVVAVE
ncbi:MAG: glycogen-binding domain-containing protein [Verrucomicrobiota bacterium]